MKYSYIAKCGLKHLASGFKLPYMVMFETTLMCIMFCEYCIFGEEGKFNDLQIRAVRDRIFKRIEEFCDMGIFALSFSGGEPLLNPSTCDYIAYAEDKGMWTSMPTNGLLIRKYAEGVARLGMLEVSIDSLNVQRFAKRRGIDALPKIIANLEFVLTKRKPSARRSTPPSTSRISKTFLTWRSFVSSTTWCCTRRPSTTSCATANCFLMRNCTGRKSIRSKCICGSCAPLIPRTCASIPTTMPSTATVDSVPASPAATHPS